MPSLNPNFRPRREHRRARHVGRLRQRLAKAIVQAFSDQGVTVRCDPARLCPALGRWRTDTRMDVFRWEGWIEELVGDRWMNRAIDSWEPMRDCIKGFSISSDGTAYLVSSVEPGCSPSERYVYEG